MGDVVDLPCYTTLPIEPDKVLTGALDKLEYVLVLGMGKDGKFYTASSTGDLKEAVWAATKLLHKIHSGDYY